MTRAREKEENQERMKKCRAAQKDQEKEQDRKALVDGVVAALGDKLEQIHEQIIAVPSEKCWML